MSGICAIYSRNGEPCNRELLTRMSQFVPARGDITGAWSQGPTGLAMTVWQHHQNQSVETLHISGTQGNIALRLTPASLREEPCFKCSRQIGCHCRMHLIPRY